MRIILKEQGRRILIDIEEDNAAFIDYPGERNRLISLAVRRYRAGETRGGLMDTNGNTVGRFIEMKEN